MIAEIRDIKKLDILDEGIEIDKREKAGETIEE